MKLSEKWGEGQPLQALSLPGVRHQAGRPASIDRAPACAEPSAETETLAQPPPILCLIQQIPITGTRLS
jgi:hypothetical protein